MASNTLCLGERQACALRVTRLDADCSPMEGEDNAVVTAALATLTLSPTIEEGATFQPKNACDQIRWTAEEDDRTTRWTGDAEFTDHDPEFEELFLNSVILVGALGTPLQAGNIGGSGAGPSSAVSPGVGLEIWVKNAGLGDVGQCGPDTSIPPYTRYVLPRVLARRGDNAFTNEAKMLTASLKASPNPQWGQGPWGDWQATVGFEDASLASETWVKFFDDTIPEDACGYIEVPASS